MRAASRPPITDIPTRLGPVLAEATTSPGGTLRIEGGGEPLVIGIRGGRVYAVRGVPNLLRDLGPTAPGSGGGLVEAVELAVRDGFDLDAVLAAASRRLGAELAQRALLRDVIATFQHSESAGHSRFLPHSPVQMLDRGLREQGSTRRTEQLLRASQQVLVVATKGSAAPPGLDPLALRVLRLARNEGPIADLVAGAVGKTPARHVEVLHRIDLLRVLGNLQVRAIENLFAEPDPAADAALRKFQEAAQRMEGQSAYHRLGLAHMNAPPAADVVANAFREVSRAYHPDKMAGVPESVRRAAAQCFALVSEAHDLIEDPATASLEWERCRSEQEGRTWVSPSDRKRAIIAYKKGERLFRAKEYAIAEACFAEATRLDPENPRYALEHVLSAFLAKQIPGSDAVARIERIQPRSPVEAGRILYISGLVQKLDGAPRERVLERFRRAVEIDPENRDAQRELRLHELRERGSGAPEEGLGARLRSLLRRKPR